ncbi:MAG: membrane protein insertase YidC, partial [bacterium]|nr:membrane protein insertase YidC [bacterium]
MFTTFLTQPIYNGFVFLIGVMPQGDVGLAIIALTLVIRIIFYPAFTSSIRTQMGMQQVQGQLDEVNKKYKNDKDARARATMQLFKDNNVKPFSGFLALLVQIPVFIALYFAFFNQGLPTIATELLYSFVP